MDLTELKWTKNINHQDGNKYCAYHIDPDLKIFKLHWKKGQEENALKPKEGQLIILRQRTKVTHIVKLLNNTLYKEPHDTEFNIYRLVQVVWIADYWSVPPDQDIIFGFHVHLQGGKVMELETLPAFKTYWDSRGGLAEFQNHVLKVLKLERDSN
ncbi:hypothetical protein H6G81_19250 [Scytonema hofmannii FACHB-248]|uniref:Uncharacterized protein n=1 Tax=Scytonema hofmannii FACHB-248 TaxID=1842502 RepID=A0ABR8GU59_9CYAN|nr:MULTISPECIES: hypothetical protein [Nostocales]MBD2606609.1 hypothetical protein [Scytonema hofmannii FACHB-248]